MPPGRDAGALQGRWKVDRMELEGHKVPSLLYGGASIEIDGDRFRTSAMGAVFEGTFTVDATARPKTIDMRFTAGPEKGGTSLGIYELEGETWRLCLGLSGRVRPRAFVTTRGSGHALEVLVREAKRARA
jgi:uncharacterized protein (TIGR03067 family)